MSHQDDNLLKDSLCNDSCPFIGFIKLHDAILVNYSSKEHLL